MSDRPELYIVDDTPEICEFVKGLAEDLAFSTHSAHSGQEFIRQYDHEARAIIWLDIVMPGQDGLEVLTWLAKSRCRDPIILSTGHTALYTDLATKLAEEQGLDIAGVVHKPFRVADVRDALTSAAARAVESGCRGGGAKPGTGLAQ